MSTSVRHSSRHRVCANRQAMLHWSSNRPTLDSTLVNLCCVVILIESTSSVDRRNDGPDGLWIYAYPDRCCHIPLLSMSVHGKCSGDPNLDDVQPAASRTEGRAGAARLERTAITTVAHGRDRPPHPRK